MTSGNPRHPGIAAALATIVVISIAIGFLAVEISYRTYLYATEPEKFFHPPSSASFMFFRNSAWSYDADVGYRYKPNDVWFAGGVTNGKLTGCDASSHTDDHGNMGDSGRDYASADFKVLVFGDSVTSQPNNNKTYPSFLESELSRRMNRRVSVVNMGRDGYSLLQMVDLAAIEVPRWKPDLVLIDFETDDIDRARFWRTEMRADGRPRVFTTTSPNPSPPADLRTDTMVIEPQASQEWCDRMTARSDQASDPILAHLIETYTLATQHVSARPSFWGLDYSASLEAVLYGDPFAFVWRRLPPATNPRLKQDKFADPRLTAELAQLHSYNIPIYFVHLPFSPEIGAQAYPLTSRQAALLDDLEKEVGSAVIDGLPYIHVAPADLPRFQISPADSSHPSLFGMQIYGESLAELVLRNREIHTPAESP
jgi:GDSL-like lipase/acylhydrolase family protein